jgi:5-histidylcysteine sulfoxide synthase/putative 4-mercaptohistidine N1-methyltranferase
MQSTGTSAPTRNPNLDQLSNAQPVSPADPLVGPRPDGWWTGPRPEAAPGWVEGHLRSLRMPHLGTCTRAEVRAYFDNGWALTEVLFSALQGKSAFLTPPYHQLRHPLVFYYGHPATLYANKLQLAGLGQSINPEFEVLFETGVDEMSWDDLSRPELAWPPMEEVTEYRRKVYALVTDVIARHPDLEPGHPPITPERPIWALFMGFEHERIHLETSAVLMRELPEAWLARPPAWPPLHPLSAHPETTPPNHFVNIPGGTVRLGKPHHWPSYGWDNEYGEQVVEVAPFKVQQHLVSNGEFLEFVKAEGYLDPALWTQTGWRWRQHRNAKWPCFWVSTGPAGLHQYRLRTIFEIGEMPWSWPVEVNFHEAQAFCAWRSQQTGRKFRLPGEAMHHCLRPAPVASADGFSKSSSFNLNLAVGSPRPVDIASSDGPVSDAFGNVWQWLEDHFHPLPGFKVHPYYDDFSTPCFDDQHQMILGGSFLSTGDEASIWARFHFRPHFFQHCGFRMVEVDSERKDIFRYGSSPANVYEQDSSLHEYMVLHYGSREDAFPHARGPVEALDFPQRCAARALALARDLKISTKRALDVGCAVGRSTFELARQFEEVLGVDLSERFIQAASALRDKGQYPYQLREEGDVYSPREAMIDPAIDRRRARFRRADACQLPGELRGYDLVMAANLLCRLPDPKGFLRRLVGDEGLVLPGGLLFVTTPGTWSETFTPKAEWLGGRSPDIKTFDGLKAALANDFELVAREDMPLLIREHRRKYQYIVADMSVWRRRS